VIRRRLVGKGGKPRKYDVNVEITMAIVLKLVGEVASEENIRNCFMFQPQTNIIFAALEEGLLC
jgi:hypothetical protein